LLLASRVLGFVKSGQPTPEPSSFASILAIRDSFSLSRVSRLPRRSIVVKSSDSGSALILVLLITALLATIAVSFLSTSRVEMIAAKNFSRQNAASGLAEMATQQAMAQIQQGFTVNGTGTTVITTQPGAITQFVFSNGNIISPTPVTSGGNITYPPTVKLYSDNGTSINAYMNNLQKPSSNSSASSNQWTITGNASERINVFMENVTTSVNGSSQVIGRIAYYVDDELTKLNLNAATDNRQTLNTSDSKCLSLSTLSSNSTILGKFRNSIQGNYNGTSDIKNWAFFFRPEQATADGNATSGGLNLSPNFLPNLTALPPRDFHMKYTPWGTRRLFINDLATDSANATASVNATYNALSDPNLRNIYGQTFADKYTALGLKQIAANMLQKKCKDTRNDSQSFAFTGNLIGSDNLDSDGIPKEYLGYARYFGIDEVGMSGGLAIEKVGGTIRFKNILQVIIQTIGWRFQGPGLESFGSSILKVDLDALTYDVNYTINGNSTNATLGGSWGSTLGAVGPFTQFTKNNKSTYSIAWAGQDDVYGQAWNHTKWDGQYLNCFLGKGNTTEEISMGFSYPASSNITINSISNMRASIKTIKILGDKTNPASIRDWVVAGRDIGDFPITLSTANLTGFSFPFSDEATTINATWANPPSAPAPSKSYSRIDGHLQSVSSLSTSSNPWPLFTSGYRVDNMSGNATYAWTGFGNSSWTKDGVPPRGFGISNGDYISSDWSCNVANSNALWTKDNMIPGDPYGSSGNFMLNYFYHQCSGNWQYISQSQGVEFWPYYRNAEFVDSSGNLVFVAPADLGKISTNYPWRTLRMQLQPKNEVAATDGGGNKTTQSIIPDWAMLDVISFGSNSATLVSNFTPHVNLNNRFTTSNSSIKISRRTALESLLKPLDNANYDGCPILQNPYNLTASQALGNQFELCYDQLGNATAAAGLGNGTTWSQLLARNIGNMTWSPLSFWGSNNTSANRVRKSKGFPTNQYVLPSEVTEIRDIADLVTTNATTFQSSTRYTNTVRHIKTNELRLSPFFPGVTTCSNFFTIYAYAQALDRQGNIDSESLTKTLVEVEISTPATATTGAVYKVKKLYTQPIPLGQ